MFIRKAFLSQVGEGFYTCEITYKFVKLNNLWTFGKYLRAGIHKFVGDFTRVKSHTKLVKPLVGDFTRVKSSPNPSKHGKTSIKKKRKNVVSL